MSIVISQEELDRMEAAVKSYPGIGRCRLEKIAKVREGAARKFLRDRESQKPIESPAVSTQSHGVCA